MKYKDIIKMPMPSPNTHNDISIEDMTKLAIKIIADDKASEQKKDAVCNALLNNAKELDRQQRADPAVVRTTRPAARYGRHQRRDPRKLAGSRYGSQ